MQIQQWEADAMLPQQLTQGASQTARSIQPSTLGMPEMRDAAKSSRRAPQYGEHYVAPENPFTLFDTPIQFTVFNIANESAKLLKAGKNVHRTVL